MKKLILAVIAIGIAITQSFSQNDTLKILKIEVTKKLKSKAEQNFITGASIREGKMIYKTEKQKPKPGIYFGLVDIKITNLSDTIVNFYPVTEKNDTLTPYSYNQDESAYMSFNRFRLKPKDSYTYKLLFILPDKIQTIKFIYNNKSVGVIKFGA